MEEFLRIIILCSASTHSHLREQEFNGKGATVKVSLPLSAAVKVAFEHQISPMEENQKNLTEKKPKLSSLLFRLSSSN